MTLPERRPPTHVLIIEIPLALGDGEELDFDPVQDALRVCLGISRVAVANALCDDPQVTLRDVAPGT